MLPLKVAATERTLLLFRKAEQSSMFGRISPDGRWMAFTSHRSGPRVVDVRPFPAGEGEWPVAVRGGQAPRWRAGGQEMFFVAPDGKMRAVPVNATPGAKPVFAAGVPVARFATSKLSIGEGAQPPYRHDVTADGSRLLIAHRLHTAASTVPPLTVVTNCPAGREK